jgi:hypothetical protein
MSTANVYTYRTPDYQLSTTQSYRPGCPGNIQHIWSVTMGDGVGVYGTNPVAEGAIPNGRPGPWQGNGILPHAVQHRNVLLALYRIRPMRIRYFKNPWPIEERVHIWVPRDRFDEIVERDRRLFLRSGDAYLALVSRPGGVWLEDGEWNISGADVVLVAELGARREYGSFDAFVSALHAAPLRGGLEQVTFESPSLGPCTTGWKHPLRVNGEAVPTADYPRFDNPWCQAEFGATRFEIACGDERLLLDADRD